MSDKWLAYFRSTNIMIWWQAFMNMDGVNLSILLLGKEWLFMMPNQLFGLLLGMCAQLFAAVG